MVLEHGPDELPWLIEVETWLMVIFGVAALVIFLYLCFRD